ncbi:MAG: phosphatidylserine/phosphatidylglycerophosphate/cardiolipin synthase family protein [Bacteroidales bacterium]
MLYPEEYSTQIFDDNLLLFSSMINDIRSARKYIYLETYRFGEDAIGKRFREALLEKAEEGIEIKLLVDAYGTKATEVFFGELLKAGVKLCYFKKIKFFISNTFARNHTRNHRKLLLIDDSITYIGSSNLTAYSLSWRELNMRIKSPITHKFRGTFLHSMSQYKFYELAPFERINIIQYHGYSIIQDTPSTYFQPIRNYMLKLIENAKSEIIAETPYFLPGNKIRKALVNAAQRGIQVTIYVPLFSDVPLIDLLRNKYLGPMFKAGVRWRFYKPDNLHAKSMIVDNKRFFVGSSNMDYRSFRYQYEIMLYGENPKTIELLKEHIQLTDSLCSDFDYEKWKNVPFLYRFIEWIITPFRRLF